MPRSRRRCLVSASLALLLLLAASCSTDRASDPAQAGVTPLAGAAPAAGKLRIALLSPGPVSDAGWNAAAYEGLQLAQKQLGAEIAQSEVRTPSEFDEGFRDYARRGYGVVWGHGFEFQEAAARVAADFPQTVFLTSGGTTVRENVAPLNFQFEEVTYLKGILAARMSRSGKLAMVGGLEIPSVRASYESFRRGAQSVRPDVQVLVSYIGSWEDTGAAKEAALALIRQGVDGVFQNCDAAGAGVFQAAREAGNVYAYGTARDQSGAAPDVVLSSSVVDIPQAFLTVVREIQEGRFKARRIDLGFLQGVGSHVLNPALKDRIPQAVLDELAAVEKDLREGRLQLPRLY
jgi:basic membrane lipoprotein Med (substrate-binding protein (PBP1-ABC) superfamily)